MTWMETIEAGGIWAIYLLVGLEYACFPLPSEALLPFAGAFAARTGVPFWQVYLGATLAGLMGCLLCYALGLYGGAPLLAWVERRFPKTRKGLAATRAWFEKHGGVSVLAGRVLPLFRTYISLFAGLSRQPVPKFLALSAVGISVWNLVLVGLGFLLAEHWEAVAGGAQDYMRFVLPIAAVAAFVIILHIRRAAKSSAAPKK